MVDIRGKKYILYTTLTPDLTLGKICTGLKTVLVYIYEVSIIEKVILEPIT
jgi:hypothetical protein